MAAKVAFIGAAVSGSLAVWSKISCPIRRCLIPKLR